MGIGVVIAQSFALCWTKINKMGKKQGLPLISDYQLHRHLHPGSGKRAQSLYLVPCECESMFTYDQVCDHRYT